jgi:hypothetical protein
MNRTLTAHLGELAEVLNDLRRRFRQAARVEVARTIGEALRDAAVAMVSGAAPMPARPRRAQSDWDDPWGDSPAEWHGPEVYADTRDADTRDADEEDRRSAIRLSPALLAGMGATRWSYTRTRQIGPAVLIGLLVALAATAGGPATKALLKAWSVANDLLSQPGSDHGG